MELDAFTSRLGEGQGRTRLTTGEVRFVLGDLDAGRLFEASPGDHVEVVQSTDLTGIALVRAVFDVRVPHALPADLAWEASIVVDGAKYAKRRCREGRRHRISDLAANVSKLGGPHEVGLRLELVSV